MGDEPSGGGVNVCSVVCNALGPYCANLGPFKSRLLWKWTWRRSDLARERFVHVGQYCRVDTDLVSDPVFLLHSTLELSNE